MRYKNMEDIKLPKFKTKEELEQFAMGLLTENESLRKVITLKDETIKSLNKQLGGFLEESMTSLVRLNKIRDLEDEIKSLKEKTGEEYYKGLYDKEVVSHTETLKRGLDYQRKFEKAEGMAHKLCSMVTFMFELLPRFKAKRVAETFGEFNIVDYRL